MMPHQNAIPAVASRAAQAPQAHLRPWLAAALVLSACASKPPPPPATAGASAPTAQPSEPAPPPKEAPPTASSAQDVKFPQRQTVTLKNGLVVDVVRLPKLPIVQMQLVVTSGRAQDPAKKPGVAALVAKMLTQGTRKRSAEKYAEAIEFLGADLHVWEGSDAVRLSMRALSEHLQPAMELMADATLHPAFSAREFDKLRRREQGRLQLKQKEATYLASREFHRVIYGEHPYAQVDTTEAVLKKMNRGDLIGWHKTYFAPNNAFLVVVGDVTAEQVEASANKTLGKWRKRTVKESPYPALPERKERQILVVDRPESVQSVIYVGHAGIRRNAEDFIPTRVANQVLGGSAASRLFMDLREKRSLTYGAYSRFAEDVDVGTFRASASVRNAVTSEATGAFLEHLERIAKDPIPKDELDNAHRYLADSFPLKIETAARVANLVADLRLFGLPENYWDSYRSSIREVGPEQASKAASQHIQPDKLLILVVGKAAEIVPGLQKFGPVSVIDTDGKAVTGDTADAAKDGKGGEQAAKQDPAKAAGKDKPGKGKGKGKGKKP